jgi:hypothetical protein
VQDPKFNPQHHKTKLNKSKKKKFPIEKLENPLPHPGDQG